VRPQSGCTIRGGGGGGGRGGGGGGVIQLGYFIISVKFILMKQYFGKAYPKVPYFSKVYSNRTTLEKVYSNKIAHTELAFQLV